jgi:antitoxin ParD1/3/4
MGVLVAIFATRSARLRVRNRKTRNVSLTPELETFVVERIASGRYRSASEVIRAALRLLERQEPVKGAVGSQPRENPGS